MSLRPAAVLIVAALAACQPVVTASSSPATSVSQSVAPSPHVAGSGSPVALASGPLMTIRLVGDSPVVTGAHGPAGHDAVLPGAVAVDADGSLVAFLVWFGKARGDQIVTLARSSDGRSWAIDPRPLDLKLGTSLAPPGAIPGAALRTASGAWLLYGWAAASSDPTRFFSWRAVATRPEGPWTVAPGQERILPPGPSGAWDDQTAAVSAVLEGPAGFDLFYEGQRAGTTVRGGIGYAHSGDGVAWTRWDDPTTTATSDPVIGPGACGPGTTAAALGPQVWRSGSAFVMLFGGTAAAGERERVYGATSADGVHWTCTGRPLLSTEDIPGSDGIHTIQGMTIAGRPSLLVESLHDGGSELWLASVEVGT